MYTSKTKFITVSTVRNGRGLNISCEKKIHTAQKVISVYGKEVATKYSAVV